MSDSALRHSLRQRLAAARARTDELFALLRPDALPSRPIPEWHRLIFYLGHFELFDWNLICRDALGQASPEPGFDELFRVGFRQPDGSHPDQAADWPAEEIVRRAIARWRAEVDSALVKISLSNPPHPYFEGGAVFNFAIEHRLMHAETFIYKLHCLPPEMKLAPPRPAVPAPPPVRRKPVEIPKGAATLGLPRGGNGVIGWDNEYEAHRVEVPAFAVDSHNVTNGEFLDFVRAGGYREKTLWSERGRRWRAAQAIEHPLHWVRRGEQWFYRTLFEEIPLPGHWPVYVAHEEAAAFARWAGKRLPSEAEFHRAACGAPDGSERAFPWGDDPPTAERGNFDFARWEPAPVGSHPAGASAFGVHDLVGNGWEWTSSPFAPFAGFEPLPFYATYSAHAFDAGHYVLKGGSARTAACLLRRSFRNWYQPCFPYAYAKFRLAEN
ncbi:MAG: SUMF1/EgtB/PvdO family nonheme iron enzyme [Candidatus Acidiferrales bacterium]